MTVAGPEVRAPAKVAESPTVRGAKGDQLGLLDQVPPQLMFQMRLPALGVRRKISPVPALG